MAKRKSVFEPKVVRYRSKLSNGVMVNIRRLPILIVRTNRKDEHNNSVCYSSRSMRKIEAAIRRIIPDYFHEFGLGGTHDKATCPGCARIKREAQQTKT